MAFKVADCDNVRETFTGAASTTITLGGAAQNSRTLSAVLTSGDTFWGTARGGAEISVGLFTYNGSTVAQTSVFYSSNSNNAVSFSSGAPCEIFIDVPGRIFDELNLTEISVASASTCDIGAAQGGKIAITGTTTITSFGTSANKRRFVRFTGALTLTHNGTSLILPGAANITTVAGDTAVFMSDASGNWRCYSYDRTNGSNNPQSSDGMALGSTSLMWSDLFLASGAVINFNNGDVTITHSSDLLTIGGGDLRITSTTVSTSDSTGALRVAGGVGIGGKLNVGAAALIQGTGNGGGTVTLLLQDLAGHYRNIYFTNGDSTLGFDNGTNIALLSNAGAWTNASDKSIKTQIENLTRYGIETFMALIPRQYLMKADGRRQIGFIAQEVLQHIPELVDSIETEGGETKLTLNYGGFAPLHILITQDHERRLAALEQRHAA